MNVNCFFNKCRRFEADLSLLAADVLENEKCAPVRAHVEACPACRAKFAELQRLAVFLKRAGNELPKVEPTASLRNRWTSAVRESVHGESEPKLTPVLVWLSGRKLAWSGIGAMWVLILFFRFSAPESSKPTLSAAAPPSLREVLLALKVDPREAQLPRTERKFQKRSAHDSLPPQSQTHSPFQTT